MTNLETCAENTRPVRLQDGSMVCLDSYDGNRVTGAIGESSEALVEQPREPMQLADLAIPVATYTVALLAAGMVVGRLSKSR